MNKVLLVLVIAFIGLVAIYLSIRPQSPTESNTLGESFTLNLFADGTSSGATRNYEASFRYADSKLVSGKASYFAEGQEGKRTCNYTFNSVSSSWDYSPVVGTNPAECTEAFNLFSERLSLNPFVTKEGIENAIKTEIIRKEGCYKSWCYNLDNQ